MSRRKIAAGNWKMHLDLGEAKQLVSAVVGGTRPEGVEVIFGVPAVFLYPVAQAVEHHPGVAVSAQNCHEEAAGAYTGEIGAGMIASAGGKLVILGHSERRELYGETDQLIEQKIRRALAAGLDVIFCCGEPLSEREAGHQAVWVEKQLRHALFSLSEQQLRKVIIAYEPIWAIGTGKTATPEQVAEMHKYIRHEVRQAYGGDVADALPILYGGSVKPTNAKDLFSIPDVDGGLIGGASLEATSFLSIINGFSE